MRKFILIIGFVILLPSSIFADIVEKDTDGFIYHLYTPSHYDPAQKYPLVVALHWSGGRGIDMLERWKEPAEKYGYIVAGPNSKESNHWGTEEDINILSMIDKIKSEYSVDDSAVLITGFSGGGMFTYYLGIRYPYVFTAMAPFAGSLKRLLGSSINLKRDVEKTIPVFIVQGTNDSTVSLSESYFARDELVKHGYTVKLYEVGGLDHQYPSNVSWIIAKWFEKKNSENTALTEDIN